MLSADEEKSVDIAGFRIGIAALEMGFAKPFAMKEMILQYNLSLLLRIFPKALFLFVQRELLSNACSLMEARQRHTGDRSTWFSVMPPGYEALLSQSPERQVAGQVLLTNRPIAKALGALPEMNRLIYDYEELCASPSEWLDSVVEKAHGLGARLGKSFVAPSPFVSANATHAKGRGCDKIKDAVSWFNSEFEMGQGGLF